MSWSSRLSASAVLLGTAFGLGGCLTPLYAQRGGVDGGAVGAELRAVAIDPVPDRLGHYLRDQLITEFNGTGATPPPRYRLQVGTSERVQTALVDVTTQRAQNASVVTDVTWTLLPSDGGPAIASGKATSYATYDRSAQRFANIRAARDAEIRDAQVLADEIRTQVAARLAAMPPGP